MAWPTPELSQRLDDQGAAEAAAAAGVAVSPLSDYFMGKPEKQGLLLGYAAVPEDEIEIGAQRLAAALREASTSAGAD
jgi:GntR family transcriptional regulator/MocR family aminotransferase